MSGKMEFVAGSQHAEVDLSAIHVTTLFNFAKYDRSKENEPYMLVSLKAPEMDISKRNSLVISACLDVSGSMNGEKLESLKKTMKKMIQHLSANDVLGIIIFDSNVHEIFKPVKMTSSNKNIAIAAVNKLNSGSSTNLSGGFLASVKQLNEIDSNNMKRILVFTDGQANEGIKNPDELSSLIIEMIGKNTLSTFGYGANYDGILLEKMGTNGKGNSYFIKSPEDISNAFARELGGLLSVFGQNIKVDISLKGVSLEKNYNDFPSEIFGSKIEISLDDIYSDETRNLLFKLKTKIEVDDSELTVSAVTVTYFDILSKTEKVIKSSGQICFVESGNKSKDMNKQVGEQIAMFIAAEAQREAMKNAEKGDFAGALYCLRSASGSIGSMGTAGIHVSEAMTDLNSSLSGYTDRGSFIASANNLRSMTKSYSTGRKYSSNVSNYADNMIQDIMLKEFSTDENDTKDKK